MMTEFQATLTFSKGGIFDAAKFQSAFGKKGQI